MVTSMPSDYHDVAHLLRRAGFGGSPSEIQALTPLSWPEVVDSVLDVSDAVPASIGVPNLNPNSTGWSQRYSSMVAFWLDRARTAPAPIVEKMVLFWHGHLCTAMDKVYYHHHLFNQNQLFRTHGMGNYEELLQAISVQPAMIWYLDNHLNRKEDPNENFARELMELFTLGIGHYTEDDVRESARAWTGYDLVNDKEDVVFDPERHDHGQKTFMGTTQNWTGPQIIHEILHGATRQQSARFMVTKLWSFFAYPDPDAALIDALAADYLAGGQRIDTVLRSIFNRPEFLSDQAKNGLVRSPIEWAVAVMRQTGLSCADANPQWTLGRMGQAPFNPPNVSGWRQNDYWVSPTAHWGRYQFASYTRWQARERGLLREQIEDTTATSAEAAADLALLQFGIDQPTAATRNALIAYANSEPNGWARHSGLLLLTPLTPDFQMA